MRWKDIREGAFAPKLPTPGEKPVTTHQPSTNRTRRGDEKDLPGKITTSPTLNGT